MRIIKVLMYNVTFYIEISILTKDLHCAAFVSLQKWWLTFPQVSLTSSWMPLKYQLWNHKITKCDENLS